MNNWTQKHSVVVLIILLIGLLIRLLPLLPPEMNLVRHAIDDAYYLFSEADNLVHGNGLSFDGVKPTTTARPLYILILALVDGVVGRANLPPIAYLLGALADILTAFLVLRFLNKLGITLVACILGMVCYIFSGRMIFFGVNGMETPFAVLSIILLLNLYLPCIKKSVAISIARGATLAVMMLLRLDYVFLAVPVLIVELWQGIKGRTWNWLLVGFTTGVIMLPWAWWSLATNGSFMPPSGDALTMIFAEKFSCGFSGLLDRILYFINTANNSLYMIIFPFKYDITGRLIPLALILIYCIYLLEKNINIKIKEILIIAALALSTILSFVIPFLRWINYIVFAIAIIYILIKFTRNKMEMKKAIKLLAPVVIGFVALAIYYNAIRLFFRIWNTIEGGLFTSIIIGVLCAILMKRKFGFLYIALILSWVMITNLFIAIPSLDKGPIPCQERFYRAAMWVRNNTEPGTVIAAANGGIIQWYGERTLVDAAGIEDLDAYKALKDYKLYDYLKKRGVQYLIDPKNWPFYWYKDYWGVDITTKLEMVYDTDALRQDHYQVPFTEDIIPIIYKLR